jgi:hypothetical protein
VTWAALIVAALALGLAAGSFGLSLSARSEAKATRGELARHRHSHAQRRATDPPARRHGERPGPEPLADEHAAPATTEMGALPPPGTRWAGQDLEP